jgi:hypothetical protein
MNISAVYQKYAIMPSLQLHMYRVAGVAKIICQNMLVEVENEDIVFACLLHDMGNILKFNFNLFPEFLQPEGREYWQKIKDQYEVKYGNEEHAAAMEIAKELQVSKKVLELIKSIEFTFAVNNFESRDIAKIICQYSDMRVTPYGVQSLRLRLEDGRKRFKLSNKDEDIQSYKKMVSALHQMEKLIFSQTKIDPEEITEEIVMKEVARLRQFRIK